MTLISFQAYHSGLLDGDIKLVGNMALLPLKTQFKGPAAKESRSCFTLSSFQYFLHPLTWLVQCYWGYFECACYVIFISLLHFCFLIWLVANQWCKTYVCDMAYSCVPFESEGSFFVKSKFKVVQWHWIIGFIAVSTCIVFSSQR